MGVNELDGNPDAGHVKTDPYVSILAGGTDELEPDLNEHYLFHGTNPAAADEITENGFRINLAGSNAGTMFGKGAYFAECPSKSDEYASTGQGIYSHMYAILVCRVCCGEMFRVTKSDIPAIEKALKGGRFDAVLGDREASVGTYREFVVYKERQIYPEYCVLYKHVFGDDDEDDDPLDRCRS